jgi:hypothetical protein
MNWIRDIIEAKLNRWHTKIHSNCDFMKILEANKEIDKLRKQNYELDVEVKKLKLQLEIKQMNNFLEGR